MFQAPRRRRGVLEVIAFLSAFLPTPTPSLLFFRFPRRPILNWRACSQAIWLALVLGSFFVVVVLCFVLFVLFCLVFWGGRELIVVLPLSTLEYNRIPENCQGVLEKIAGEEGGYQRWTILLSRGWGSWQYSSFECSQWCL